MRGTARLMACVVVMLVGTAQPADAFWRWLEHMSGPGWFNGYSLEIKLRGSYPDLEGSEDEVIAIVKNETSTARLRALERREKKRTPPRQRVLDALKERLKGEPETDERAYFVAGGVISPPLLDHWRFGDIKQPRMHTFGWSGGVLWSTINRLRYDPSVPPEDTQVWILTTGPFYDYRIVDRLEIGASAEAHLFFGKAMKRKLSWAFEPRATLTLIRIRDQESGNPAFALKLRGGLAWIPNQNPEAFGALPGEPLGPEVLKSLHFILDFECLPWRRNAC